MPNDDEKSPNFEVDESGDADDDIIDLLEVVKPGRPLSAAEQDDADFTDDLESMLDDLSREELSSAQSGVRKFPDPTPVDYRVDHNERLDIPDMDDLDNILQSLGADGRRAAHRESGAVEPLPDIKEPPLSDLDAVPLAGDDEDEAFFQAAPAGGGTEDEDAFPLHVDTIAEKADEEAIELDMDGLGELLAAVPPPPPDGAAQGPAGEGKPVAPVADTASPPEPTLEAVPAARAAAAEPPPDLLRAVEPEDTGPAAQQDSPPPAAPPKTKAPSGAAPGPAPAAPPVTPPAQAAATEPPHDPPQVTGPEETAPAPHHDAPPPAAPEAPQATPAAPAPAAEATAPGEALEAEEGESQLPPDVLDALSDVYPDYADDVVGAYSTASLDDVDLVEMDALLDDMLSNAPASGPGPAPGDVAPRFAESSPSASLGESAASRTGESAGGVPADANGKAGSPQSSLGSGQSSDVFPPGQKESSRAGSPAIGFEEAANLAAIPGLIRELNALRGDLETLRGEAGSARTETGDAERIGKRLDSFSAGLASQASRLEDLELAHMAGANKETAREQSAAAAASTLAALEEQAGRAETALAALEEQARQAEAALAALREQTGRAEAGLASLEARAQRLEDAHARLHADLDKMT
ncbi:MAG: hypothetical protein LBC14_03450, partial [Desulfovibrio sp.]|nr:hypothetical protein [Desulfovibrio sp.]